MADLPATAFLQLVLRCVEDAAPDGVRPWQSRIRHGTLQIFYGNPRVHYELWLQSRNGRVELGLHFEDEAGVNQRWCAYFAEQVFELQERFGPAIELEEWTASWTRLHLTVPFEPLTPAYAAALARDFGMLIEATCEDVRRGLPAATRA